MFDIEIDNFRGFTNTSTNISKMNILIGENNGGKTSFIKFLLMLKQSLSSFEPESRLVLDGPFVDLGNFNNIIKNNDNKNVMTLKLITHEEYIKYFLHFLDLDSSDYNSFLEKHQDFISSSIELEFKFDINSNHLYSEPIKIFSKDIGTITITIDEDLKDSFSRLDDPTGKVILEKNDGNILEIPTKFTKNGFMLFSYGEPIWDYLKLNFLKDDIIDYEFHKLAFLLVSQNYFDFLLKSIRYINPMNFKPERIYIKRDASNLMHFDNYESLIKTLSKMKNNKKIFNKFNKAIAEFGIAERIDLKVNNEFSVLELRAKIGNLWNNITDVGFGVSLQIPIILQAIISGEENPDSILIIEQPEIHLHPALHSKFIEILIKYSNTNKIIIETHSEHIIRKLQVLVKNNVISINDININYFKKTDDSEFVIHKHKILSNGRLEPAFPDGFYDNSYNLSRELY